jgi:hypothetical protein
VADSNIITILVDIERGGWLRLESDFEGHIAMERKRPETLQDAF